MSSIKVKNNIHWIGVRDEKLRVFDIIMNTKRGTTYNSYLIDDEKVAIIDSVKDKFSDEFLSNIKEVIGDKKVDYIVVQHTELDHSGSIINLMERYPEAKVIGTKAAVLYLKEIVNKEFQFEIASEKFILDLGKVKLNFIPAPNLHWPDTMFTLAKYEKVLFTCDFLGCHYAPINTEGILSEGDDEYLEEMKYYYDCIMGPFAKFVQSGLKKIEDLDLEFVCASHGPIHTKDNIKRFKELYKEWSKVPEVAEKNVQIFYISAYGNTGKMANFFSDKIKEKGIKCEVHEITECDINYLIEKAHNASCIMVGSPTINQDAVLPAWDLTTKLSVIAMRGKAGAAFGACGWSGEGVVMLQERLKSLKLKTLDKGFSFKFVPNDTKFKVAENYLEELLALVK